MTGRISRSIVRLFVAAVGALAVLDLLRSSTGSGSAIPEERGDRQGRAGLKRWILTAAALLAAAAVTGLLVVGAGLVPIKASSGHWAITAWFLKFTMQRSVAAHSLGLDAPRLDDPALVQKGGSHYDTGCRPCHGSPDLRTQRIARQMTPRPPYLSSAAAYDPEDLFYIVKHGVKFTGMPAWPAQTRDDEVWAMVAFLQVFPRLTPEDYAKLVGGSGGENAAVPMAALDVRQPPRPVAESCSRCHGPARNGRDVSAFPSLAGQRPDYLLASLRAYADGRRHSGIMEPVAVGLDAEAMQEVAQYYAGLERQAPASSSGGTIQTIERGMRIATAGIPDQLVPPCVKCHGPGGPPRNPQYPVLAGQYADYLALQLTLFKENRRGGTAYKDIMRRIAGQLTVDQIRDVAAYFAALSADEGRANQ